MLCARLEGKPSIAPLNGPSQWFWGERAAERTDATWSHTALGYVTHHASAIFWATLHEKMFGRPDRNGRVVTELGRAAMTSVLAAFVDYALTPRRFQPGFEKHLSIPSLVLSYAAFGVGLAAGRVRNR